MAPHQVVDLAGELASPFLSQVCSGEKIKRRDDPIVVDPGQVFSQMGVICIIEQHHWPFNSNKHAARLVMRTPDLHVGGISRIACVDLIKQQQTGNIRQPHLLPQTREPVASDDIKIDWCFGILHSAMLTRHGISSS